MREKVTKKRKECLTWRTNSFHDNFHKIHNTMTKYSLHHYITCILITTLFTWISMNRCINGLQWMNSCTLFPRMNERYSQECMLFPWISMNE